MVDAVSDVLVPLGAAAMGAAAGVWSTLAVSHASQVNELYNRYLERCFDNPDLSSTKGFLETHGQGRDLSFDPYSYESDEVEKYHWFIGLMMNAMEGIISAKFFLGRWRPIVADQVELHRLYFEKSWQSNRASCSKKMIKIVEDVLSRPVHAQS